MKLVLGVIDIPYQNPPSQKRIPQAKKGKANKPIHAVSPPSRRLAMSPSGLRKSIW
jgi:hypothetical protein